MAARKRGSRLPTRDAHGKPLPAGDTPPAPTGVDDAGHRAQRRGHRDAGAMGEPGAGAAANKKPP